MVWLRRKIFWFSKDTAKVHSDRKRKNRQTGEEVGRQYQRVYWNGLGSSSRAAENRTRLERIVANSSVVPQRSSEDMG